MLLSDIRTKTLPRNQEGCVVGAGIGGPGVRRQWGKSRLANLDCERDIIIRREWHGSHEIYGNADLREGLRI